MADDKIVDQPAPVARPDRSPVWSLVIKDFMIANADFSDDGISDRVLSDMRERDAAGRARYGVPLTTDNGRDHLVDAYQECLDLAVYLRAWLEENPLTALSLHVEVDLSKRSRVRDIQRIYNMTLDNLWFMRWVIAALQHVEAP